MKIVDLKNLGYTDEPFVLANDVAQVIYVKDMSTKPRKRKDKEANTSYGEPKCHIVLSGKRDIVGVEDKTDMSEDYEKFQEIPPFNVPFFLKELCGALDHRMMYSLPYLFSFSV